ncbi:MAG: putative Heparinase family protein [Gemmatimonadetes bacterium]|nr:putative Heparinase family protein [Gemmatimonadota bacterium]
MGRGSRTVGTALPVAGALVNVARLLGKLKGRSLAEFRERAGQKLSAELEAHGLASTVRLPADLELANELSLPDSGQRDISTRVHEHFSVRQAPAFLANIGAAAVEMRLPRWSNETRKLVEHANRIVAGQFDLLGYTALSFGSPVDWHLDPTTGRRAPRAHWSRIPYLDASIIGDHKVIWEINRHQQFFVLGRAYLVTGDARFAECFAEQLSSWMDENPPKQGVNWASSLEIAYRSIAWLWAFEFFRGAAAFTPEIHARALKHLLLNGRHLERYLSTYFSPNTHLTGEALGLLSIGTLLPEFHRASAWRELGWGILERHIPLQVLDDGVYFEQATYYHRYTVDIYLHAVLLRRSAGAAVSARTVKRLDSAVGYLADLTRPDGSIPVIGDDDGGRLVLLESRNLMDVRAALGTASVTLARDEYAAVAGGATEELLWLLGPAAAHAVDINARSAPPAHLSTLFPAGGYAVMRDGWGAGANHAVIDCGPLGAMNCGHAHADALSIEISVAGCAMIVDPGTYTYTVSPEERDHFRHSASHNTVTVDGQSSSVPSGPFSWAHRADAKVERWSTGAHADVLVASQSGFMRLADPVQHRRTVLFVRSAYWVIVDTLVGAGEHTSTAHFHTAIGSDITPLSPTSALISTPCATGTARLLFSVAGDVDALVWGHDWVSPAYGVRTKAPHGQVTARGAGRRDIITVLVPVTADDTVSVREQATSSGRAVLVDRLGVQDFILLSTGGGVVVGNVTSTADVAVVRRTGEGAAELIALAGEPAEVTGMDTLFTDSPRS